MKWINRANHLRFIVFFLLAVFLNPAVAFPREKKIVGLIEKVRICPGALEVTAKVDTGAGHSSLDVSHIVEFDRGGVKWVRFDVINNRGQKRTIERKVFRMVRIKRHGQEAEKEYSIRLGVCLGDYYRETQVNLADRTGFSYRMLIGRGYMNGAFVVDPSLKFTTRPECAEACRN